MSFLSKTLHLFRKKPLMMNMTTIGTLCFSAELSQQVILKHIDPNKESVDWKSVGRYVFMGTLVLGPTLFYWFRFLDRVMPGSGLKAMRKVMVDQVVGAPITTSMFFVGMSLLEGKEDIFAELKAKFLSTYAMSCCFWLPAQAINFCFLPPYTRVAYVGCASFVWVNILCLIKRQEVPTSTEITEVETSSAVKAS